MKFSEPITYGEAHKAFEYKNGGLYWRSDGSGGRKSGNRAGCIAGYGYRQICLKGKRTKEHRFVWLMHYGEWPKRNIDHINGITDDNRIENLRLADHDENAKNSKRSNCNSSGYTGVCWHGRQKKWTARICVNYKEIHIGTFETKQSAIDARKAAEIEYGFHKNHGRD